MASDKGEHKRHSKKKYHVQVGQYVMVFEVSIAPHAPDKILMNDKKKQSSKMCNFEWFKEIHLVELLKNVKKVVKARVDASNSEKAGSMGKCQKAKSVNMTTENLKVSYNFKRRCFNTKQFALLKNYQIYHLSGRIKRNVNYNSLSFFHEKLIATVWKQPVKDTDDAAISLQHSETATEPKAKVAVKNDTSSSYFTAPADCLITSSVKRKKNSLKKMAKKSKMALLKLPASEPTGNVISERDENSVEECSKTTSSDDGGHSSGLKNDKSVIDLEKKPKGLDKIKRVEDLQTEHLKYLIDKMEDYLRTIFRGEVYCRRHEEYKKGGKSRDNLNFQVGMAHFNEDQHDCIMDSLMAMFCSRHTWYTDYVVKVMLPQALIKLYQDIHNTSSEQEGDQIWSSVQS